MALIDATRGRPGRVISALAVPAIVQSILHTAYGFNDYVFVARLGDTPAIAALSACFGVSVVIFGFSELVSVGAHTMIAQLTGAGALRRRRRLIQVSCLLGLGIGLVVTMAGLSISGQIAGTLNLEPRATLEAQSYLHVLLTGFPALALLHLTSSAWRGMGYTIAPVVMEAGTLVLNTFGNGLFVLGWFGAPRLGVAGAALATVGAAVPATVCGLFFLLRTARRSAVAKVPESNTAAESTNVRDDLWEIIRIGAPASLIPLLYGLVYLALNRLAGAIGEAAQAGLGSALRGVEWVAWSVCLGYYVAGSVAVGQCIGAGDSRRARTLAVQTLVQSIIVVEVVGLLMAVFADLWMEWVVGDPQARALGVIYLHWMGPSMFLVAIEVSLEGVMVGAGETLIPMRISGVMNMVRIPLAAALVFGMPQMWSGVSLALGLGASGLKAPGSLAGCFLGMTISVIISSIGKAIWALIAVRGIDLPVLMRKRRAALGVDT